MFIRSILVVVLVAFLVPAVAVAQRQSPEELIKIQKEEMKPLEIMNGTWRGQAWIDMGRGERITLTQTERVGSMLDGTVKVIEGRGYDADGNVAFNAFATVAYDPAEKQLTMHSHAQGRVGNFVLERRDNGYSWTIPAGPMTIKYVAAIEGETWTEYGERSTEGSDPIRFFEMKLKRVGDTDWPAGGVVPMTDEGDGKTR